MCGLHSLFNGLTGRNKNKKIEDQSNKPLYKAVKAGSTKRVRNFLRKGADPNICDSHRLSPLHLAAYWGETEIVRLLLKHGAKADWDNGKGWTALHSAAVSGSLNSRKDIIDMLVKAGADLDKKDKCGWTPRDYMTLWETNAEAAEKLKKYLAELEGIKPASNTPQKPPHINTPKH